MRPVLLLAALLLAGCNSAPSSHLATVPLSVETRKTGPHAFTVEVAASEAEQEHGLMARNRLAPGGGMVFPFPVPRTASFWMKDTLIPLDLLFVRPDGTIAAVRTGKPKDLHPLFAEEPVSAVVEIAGGSAARLGIAPGDRVRWGDCAGAADQPGVMADPMRFCPAKR